jgi:pimeloyl-ACP methyl ester carboxylesterase
MWQNALRRKLYGALGSDYFNAGSLKETFKKVVSEDLSEYAAKITIPTLLIWGRNDASTPLSQAEKIHELIEHSQLDIVMDAGHFVHKKKPAEVAKFITAFL